ncbi:hypothetical protein JOQ06_007256 [Pogonophryne albipinna]|uniref:STAS domain-containing protein n=1 Tax=Pogonophryne albipinna TaxID=1090488 RepID=A0AAD6B2H8_9TELE|nr:hypothetical protein JOQ06_007256 [Pogonophryne albipinna]
MQRLRPRYVIDRPAFNLPDFDQEFDKKSRQFPVGEKVKKLFRCSALRLQALLFRLLPILRWLPKYKPRESLLRDVVSGVSGGTIQVPQGMAFALLANLPPVNGLYSSFFPLIPYFFMGTVHQMVPESDFSHFNETLNATVVDTEQMNEVRLGISGTLACLTAVIQIGLGFMQFGFVAIYLSESFIRGFMTAAGLQILISVLKYIFGIKVPPYSGPLAAIYTLVDIFRGLPETNVASLVFALVSSVVLIAVKELNARYRHKLPFPFPMEIIIVVVSTAISGPLHLPEKYHMDIVGEIALGFPAPILPKVGQWEEMLGTAFSLAVVGYVINLAMGRTLAAKHGYDVDPNQEMLALGCSNFLGSFFKIHVICCALSVTLAVDSAGGTSQFASLCVMLVVMVTMLSLGAFLKPLPKWEEMLGTAFSLAVVGYVINLAMGRTLAAKHGYDVDPNQEMLALGCSNFLGSFFKIHVICCALSVTLAVDSAGGTSQFASLCVMLVVMVTMLSLGAFLKPLPKSVLGALIAVNLKNTLLQLSDPYYLWKKSRLDCCVWVVSFLATFFLSLPYGVAVGVGFSILVVIFKTQFRNGSAVAQIMDTDIYKNPKVYSKIISQLEMQDDFDTSSQNTSYVNFHSGDANVGEQDPPPPTLELKPTPFHTLILDLPGVCFMDLTGINTLIKMNSSYTTLGIKLYLANVQAQVYEELEAGGAFDDGNISRSNLFLSVHDAVVFAQQSSAERRVSREVISITGVKIVNYCSPLYFANAEMFRQRVIKKTGLDPGKLILARRNLRSSLSWRCRMTLIRAAKTPATLTSTLVTPMWGSRIRPPPTLELKPTPFHTLILDLPGVCFMDLTGINTLIKMNSSYTTLGIKLYLANVQAQVYEELEAGGAFDDGNISRSNLFLSVHDAVVFAQQSSAERRVSREELSSNINVEKDLEQEMFEH